MMAIAENGLRDRYFDSFWKFGPSVDRHNSGISSGGKHLKLGSPGRRQGLASLALAISKENVLL